MASVFLYPFNYFSMILSSVALLPLAYLLEVLVATMATIVYEGTKGYRPTRCSLNNELDMSRTSKSIIILCYVEIRHTSLT